MSSDTFIPLTEVMKKRYEEESTRKETLDQKANNMMTISGTVVTLYSGFGVATATNLFQKAFRVNITNNHTFDWSWINYCIVIFWS